MRTRIPGMVLLGATGIFASVVLMRRPREEIVSRPSGERHCSTFVQEPPEERGAVGPSRGGRRQDPPEGTPASPRAVPVLRPPPEGFWEGLGALLETRSGADPERYRREMMLRTAEYLELDPSRAGVFQSVALQTLTAIQDAWRVRDSEVLSLPASDDAEERDQREQEIQERYETAKRKASGRLESLLGTTACHEQFRQKLGEWIDAVR